MLVARLKWWVCVAVALLQLLPALSYAFAALPTDESVTVQCCDTPSAANLQDDDTCADPTTLSECTVESLCDGCDGYAQLSTVQTAADLWSESVHPQAPSDYRNISLYPSFKPPKRLLAIG